MSDGDRQNPDKQKQLRGNTGFDPKPEDAARRNAVQRGLGGPAPTFAPGGSARSFSHRQILRGPEAQAEEKAQTKGVPIVEKGQEGEQRPFRKFGSHDAPKREQGQSEPSKGRDEGKKPFRGFGRGDISRDFNDRSR